LSVTVLAACSTTEPRSKLILPGIWLDEREKVLRLDGKVCFEQGVLEYLAVAEGGKEYESVFSLACRPAHLHAALLLAGYNPEPLPVELRGDYAGPEDVGAPEPRSAGAPSHASIDVELPAADGTWQRCPVESLLTERRTGQPPARLIWAFTGSFFERDETQGGERFAADIERSIALWYDPTALLNMTRDVGNAYRSAAAGLDVNRTQLPARGTPVRLVFMPTP
jgi:hypothetical protein